MSETRPRFACQTYSWQMTQDKYRGRVAHMTRIAAEAGFTGFEPETLMLGNGWNRGNLQTALDSAGLSLAALCLVGRWRQPEETGAERKEADVVIDTVAGFPGSIINLVMYPGDDREHLRERQDNALACMKAIGRRAAKLGVITTFHPNSPVGSVFRTAADYDYLLEHLDTSIGFTPDIGHIAAGGMDPIEMVKRTLPLIRHVHIKDIDADGQWAATGEGVLNILAVVDLLVSGGYEGWIAFEDESELARSDPDAAVSAAGNFVRDVLSPEYLDNTRTHGRSEFS